MHGKTSMKGRPGNKKGRGKRAPFPPGPPVRVPPRRNSPPCPTFPKSGRPRQGFFKFPAALPWKGGKKGKEGGEKSVKA